MESIFLRFEMEHSAYFSDCWNRIIVKTAKQNCVKLPAENCDDSSEKQTILSCFLHIIYPGHSLFGGFHSTSEHHQHPIFQASMEEKQQTKEKKTEHIFRLEGLATVFFQAEFAALPTPWLKERSSVNCWWVLRPPGGAGDVSRRCLRLCVCNMSGQAESFWVDGNIILKGPVGSQKTKISWAMIKEFR